MTNGKEQRGKRGDGSGGKNSHLRDAAHPLHTPPVIFTDTPTGSTQNKLDVAIRRAQQNLLRLQHSDGYWCGELFVDSTLCSDYVLYMHWAEEVDPVLQEKCVAHVRRRQLDDGGGNIYEGGPSEVRASVK